MENWKTIPIYGESVKYAREHDELPEWRASHKANIACRDAIDEAISRHYENNRLSSGAVRDVVQKFGLERTLYVTANTFRHKDWDGRISRNNKEWAQNFPVVPDINSAGDDRTAEFVANSHPGLLDIFAAMLRRYEVPKVSMDTENLALLGYEGSWRPIDQCQVGGHDYFLLTHTPYSPVAPMPVADDQGRVVITNAPQGFNRKTIARLEDFEAHDRDSSFAWKGPEIVTGETSGLCLPGQEGSWYTIGRAEVLGQPFYLMESEKYGDEAAALVVDSRGRVMLDDVWNGFDDETLDLLRLYTMPFDRLPDPSVTDRDMEDYGYTQPDMLPMRKDAARRLLEEGCFVYALHPDDTCSGPLTRYDLSTLEKHGENCGFFGVEKKEWQTFLEREKTQSTVPARELTIYQLNDQAESVRMRFMNYDYLNSHGFIIEAGKYDAVYTGPMMPGETLEDIYTRFNRSHPEGYQGHSLSVSDVVVLHKDDGNTAYFVDSFGFKEIPDFFQQAIAESHTDHLIQQKEETAQPSRRR